MKNSCWVVELKDSSNNWFPSMICHSRDEARKTAKYFSGFAYRTKMCKYRVRRYVEV